MRKILVMCLLLAVCAAGVSAQEAESPLEKAVIAGWKNVHKKVLDMAGDFPEEFYDSRPHPDSRSFAEEVRHVTIGVEMFAAQLQGEGFHYGNRNAFYAERPKTRESLVADLERAINEVVSLLEAEGEMRSRPQLGYWLGHQSEHYGKLTAIYRLNNLVPPATVQLQKRLRRQQEQRQQ
jgi:uncharacterized damage-inducible protein DinB